MFHGKKTWRLHNHMVALITERAAVNRLSHQTLAANAQKYSERCNKTKHNTKKLLFPLIEKLGI